MIAQPREKIWNDLQAAHQHFSIAAEAAKQELLTARREGRAPHDPTLDAVHIAFEKLIKLDDKVLEGSRLFREQYARA